MSESANIVLVVDDDAMNRKLTTMLLKKMNYESRMAASGSEALEMIRQADYAAVLMDYRMPDMDGVETTKIIRSMEGAYFKEVPVIALTGDEREDIRKEFSDAGINDFLQKPLNAECLAQMLKRWPGARDNHQEASQPIEILQEDTENGQKKTSYEEYDFLQKFGISAQAGIQNCGSLELWLSFLKDFYNLIDLKTTKLEKCLSEGKVKEYTIEVHALKNSARLIGALDLSVDFGLLEEWGNLEEVNKITEKHPQMLQKMIEYKEVLKTFDEEANKERIEVSTTQIKEVLWAMKDAVDSFDIDAVDFCMTELEKYDIPGCDDRIKQLRAYVADVAWEDILAEISEITYIIEKAE